MSLENFEQRLNDELPMKDKTNAELLSEVVNEAVEELKLYEYFGLYNVSDPDSHRKRTIPYHSVVDAAKKLPSVTGRPLSEHDRFRVVSLVASRVAEDLKSLGYVFDTFTY